LAHVISPLIATNAIAHVLHCLRLENSFRNRRFSDLRFPVLGMAVRLPAMSTLAATEPNPVAHLWIERSATGFAGGGSAFRGATMGQSVGAWLGAALLLIGKDGHERLATLRAWTRWFREWLPSGLVECDPAFVRAELDRMTFAKPHKSNAALFALFISKILHSFARTPT